MSSNPTFDDLELAPQLLHAVADLGFTRPTSIQQQAIPAVLDGVDVLGSAPTGTGKTMAFLLPALQYLLDHPRKKAGPPRILILVPTRELAMQVAEQTQLLAKYTNFNIATITGGVDYAEHGEIFNTNQDIVIATTGRLLEYIDAESFDCRAVEMLILDEADRLLEMGFGQDAERISAETRWRKQTLLFSATLEGDLLQSFCQRLLDNPILVTANPSRRERKKIHQWYYHTDSKDHKLKQLARFITTENVERGIVFVRKREECPLLSENLRKRGIRSTFLQGEMSQDQRNLALERLKSGVVKILVATDVASRGIDIENVTHVMNFDLPYSADAYIHRIGRTARAGNKGWAVSFVEAHDYPLLGKINRYLQIREEHDSKPLKARVIKGLEPRTKAPKDGEYKSVTKKSKARKKTKLAEKQQQAKKQAQKAKAKLRAKDQKNIGKRRKPTLKTLKE